MTLGFWTRIKIMFAGVGRRAFSKRKSDYERWEELHRKWVEDFPWESEAQRKGMLALVLWSRNLPDFVRSSPMDCLAAFIFQKDHESAIWFTEMMGNQITMLQNEIKLLQDQITDLRYELNRAKEQLPLKIV
jgi:hypothetical protein